RVARNARAAARHPLVRFSAYTLMVLAAACAATPPPSASKPAAPTGYVVSSDGKIMRDNAGRCVRSSGWQPDHAIRACEPEMFARLDAEKAKAEAERKAREEAEARRAQEEAERQARERAEAARRAQAQAAAAAAAAKAREPVWRTVGGDAYFATDEAELNARAKRMLETLAQRARTAEQSKISVVGHADYRGDPKYNMALSKRRAEAVRTYLEAQGVPGDAIAVDARGASDPVLDCSDRPKNVRAQCLQVNRRSEVVLSVLEPRGTEGQR